MIIPNFKNSRKQLGLKQKDIAIILNIHKTTLSNWEKGRDTFPIKQLIKYANHFQFSLDYLFGITNINEEYVPLEPDLKSIGITLKTLRKENNLTLQNVADILHCQNSTISHYEGGRQLVSTPILYALKDIYKFNSFDEILGRKK